MLTNIRYILITASRDKVFIGLLIGLVAATLISRAMGYTALLEPEQMTMTFSAASARMILAVGLIVFVCFHVRHAFDSKEIDVLLEQAYSGELDRLMAAGDTTTARQVAQIAASQVDSDSIQRILAALGDTAETVATAGTDEAQDTDDTATDQKQD